MFDKLHKFARALCRCVRIGVWCVCVCVIFFYCPLSWFTVAHMSSIRIVCESYVRYSRMRVVLRVHNTRARALVVWGENGVRRDI